MFEILAEFKVFETGIGSEATILSVFLNRDHVGKGGSEIFSREGKKYLWYSNVTFGVL